jgi:hypothetical protein
MVDFMGTNGTYLARFALLTCKSERALAWTGMAINEHWNIKSRSHECCHTTKKFVDGEFFYTALFEDAAAESLVRRDYSEVAWKELAESFDPPPHSYWRSKYEAPVVDPKSQVVEKHTAETLLRQLVEEDNPVTENARYVLAVMLERKKNLKQTGTRETEESTYLIYEQNKTGEVFIIRDPELKLWELEPVQREVAYLLGGNQASPSPPA